MPKTFWAMKDAGGKDRGSCEDLGLEDARKFDCCKDLTDDEILELLAVLKVFTEIYYAVFEKKKAQAKKGKSNEENDFQQAA